MAACASVASRPVSWCRVNAKQVWQAALGELQVQLSRPNFETWLRQAVAVSLEGDRFTLRAHSTLAAEWLDRRLRPQIEQTLRRVVGRPLTLDVVVGHAPKGAVAESPGSIPLAGPPPAIDDRRGQR